MTGSQSGLQVGVVGTPLVASVDDEGQFALAQVPAGTVTLKLEGAGIDARVSVPGLQDGQVTSIKVQLAGGSAQLAGSPSCAPTAETFFSGLLESIAGTRLVVSGRPVEAGPSVKVWRGDRRSSLDSLQVGDKVKVWGTLRGDGVVVAEEIQALTTEPGPTGWTWVVFSGVVESLKASSLDVHANPNTPSPSAYPTLDREGHDGDHQRRHEVPPVGRQPLLGERRQGRPDRHRRGVEADGRHRQGADTDDRQVAQARPGSPRLYSRTSPGGPGPR